MIWIYRDPYGSLLKTLSLEVRKMLCEYRPRGGFHRTSYNHLPHTHAFQTNYLHVSHARTNTPSVRHFVFSQSDLKMT